MHNQVEISEHDPNLPLHVGSKYLHRAIIQLISIVKVSKSKVFLLLFIKQFSKLFLNFNIVLHVKYPSR